MRSLANEKFKLGILALSFRAQDFALVYLVLNEFFVYFQFLLCSSILQEKFKKGLKEKACCCADHRSHQNGGLSVLAATENEVEEIPMTTNLTGAVSSKPQETHV